MKRIIVITVFFVQSSFGLTLTSLVGNSYRAAESATFSVTAGAGTYLLDLSGYGGSASESDPTLILTAGETYQFTRTEIGHDILIVNAAIPTAENSDGTLYRTVTDSTSLNSYALTENITGNSSADVTWTPSEAGIYYYTCYFPSHQQMFGKIVVVPARSHEGAFRLSTGTTINVANSGASHYLLDLSSHGGSSAEPDPTLVLTAGETYSFLRTSSGHSIALVDGSIPTGENGDGTLYRAIFDSSLDTYDVTENIVGNSTSSVMWTPQEAGTYYYTCDVTGHAQMFGKLIVLSTPVLDEVRFDNAKLELGVTNTVSNTIVYVEQCAELSEEKVFERTHLFVPTSLSTNLTFDVNATQGFYRLVSEEY